MIRKILFFGDCIGKPGRRALSKALVSFREQYSPDLVIVNVENLAHGKGVTPPTLAELTAMGVDVFTSGNHVFDKGVLSEECFRLYPNLIRPSNYQEAYPGVGFVRFEKDGTKYLVLNLNGKVFFETQFSGGINNPFYALDSLLDKHSDGADIILLDLHAEATSEKQAMGFYADGRISAFFGTHTHVPTADFRILPLGTGYITDAGMCGPLNSVIGVKIENSLKMFLEQGKFVMEPAEESLNVVNGVYVEVEGLRCRKIERVSKIVEINI